MITIDKKKIKIIDDGIVRSGSFGSINKCLLHDKTYAYKRFYSKDFLNGKRKKFDHLSKMKSENFIIPKFFVEKDGYLSKFCEGKNIIYAYDSTDKITILKKARKLITKMHEAGIIHGDLNMGNIMFDDNNVFITDFDNSSYGKYSMNLKEASNLALSFIKKYGIIPELDVFLFNYATYYILNNCITSNGIPFSIRNNDCGIFTDKDQIEICNSLLLENDNPTKNYLIDTMSDTKTI